MCFLRTTILVLIVLPLLTASWTHEVSAQSPETPKYEFRSSWLTTAWGLDWPSGSGASNHQQQMINILNQLESQNMNAVVFQASARGDAYYQSERLPWAYNLTGTPGQDPGWDPLQFLIDEASKRGLEVHVWFNAFTTAYASANDAPSSADIPNVRFTNPEWMESGGWMNPAFPDAREWHVENVMELVENYDIDAIHFDRIRYASGGYSRDDSLMTVYNPDNISGLNNWRRHNVSEFMRLVHEGIQEIKPWVKIGVTPVGHYNAASTDGWGALLGYSSVFQDSRYWAEAGYVDYIAPQLYWDIGGTADGAQDSPRFEFLANDWVKNRRNDRHIYIGIAAYVSYIRSQIGEQIDTSRVAGAEGQIFFRNDNIATSSFSGRYDSKALVPPMPWRTMRTPNRVRDLVYDTEGNDIILAWNEPDPGRGETDPFFRYVVYRMEGVGLLDPGQSINDPANILQITGDTTIVDEGAAGDSEEGYTYLVTATSRNNIEGDYEMMEVVPTSITDPAMVAETYELEQNYPNPFNPITSISFRIPESGQASLHIYDMLGRRVATLVDEHLAAGEHRFELDGRELASGMYIYRLQSGGFVQSKKMTLVK